MVTHTVARNRSIFGAIADPTRRAILDRLRAGEQPAGELASQFRMSRPAVSRHIRILKDAGLVRESRAAQSRRYSLNPGPLVELDQWLAGYRVSWAARLHDLTQYVEEERAKETE